MNGMPLALLCPLAIGLAATPSPDFASLEKVVQEELRETGTPGAAVAVVSGEQIVFAKGFGVASVETGAPVGDGMLFQVGSMTKTFTAAAIVSLAEEGRLRMDAPIGTYVQGLAPRLGRLTMHQLLSQTSGLRDEGADYGSQDEAALGATIRAWTEDRLLLEPGKAFSYSNPGFSLAGLVLETIEGKPYADVIEERILKPLGMGRSTFRPTRAMTHPLAVGHSGERDRPHVVRPMANDTRHWPAGYLYSSIQDLARFAGAFQNEGRLEGKQVLSPAVIVKMSTPYAEFPPTFDGGAYGYGLFMDDARGIRVAGHGGQMPGFSAEWRFVPSRRVAVIVLANREGLMFRRTVAQALEPHLPPVPARPGAPSVPMTTEEMTRYAGRYVGRWSMELLVKQGALFLKWGGGERPVTKIEGGRFLASREVGDPVEFRIVPGADGRPEYLQMFLWVFRREGISATPVARGTWWRGDLRKATEANRRSLSVADVADILVDISSGSPMLRGIWALARPLARRVLPWQ